MTPRAERDRDRDRVRLAVELAYLTFGLWKVRTIDTQSSIPTHQGVHLFDLCIAVGHCTAFKLVSVSIVSQCLLQIAAVVNTISYRPPYCTVVASVYSSQRCTMWL